MSERTAHYFAYGANMDAAVLRRRGLEPLAAEPARLEHHRLEFAVPGLPLVEPGFATLVEADGETVHGVLYTMTEADLAALDGFEGSQERFRVVVFGAENRPVRATAYRGKRLVPGRTPSRRYLSVVVRGARAHGLPAPWIAHLEDRPTAYVPLLSELFGLSLWLSERLLAFFR